MATELFRRLGEPEFTLTGDPLAGGKVYYYRFGTTTLQNTYLNATGATPNTNPIVLDGNGRFPTAVYLGDTGSHVAYKQVIKTAADVELPVTMDNIPAATASASSGVFSPELVTWQQKTTANSPVILTAADAGSAYEGDTTAGSIVFTLPTPASVGNGKGFIFKKTSALNVIAIGAGASTIDGASAIYMIALNREIKISSNGAKWYIDRNYDPVPGGLGEVRSFAFSAVPSGWLECNGAAIARLSYISLFAKIGIIHGPGDGTTTFNLPDYRGFFLRGWDHGVGRDPAAASRVAPLPGGASGDNVGSAQFMQMQAHQHFTLAGVDAFAAAPVMPTNSNYAASQNSTATISEFDYVHAGTATVANVALTSVAGAGTETRPLNANVLFCIKTE